MHISVKDAVSCPGFVASRLSPIRTHHPSAANQLPSTVFQPFPQQSCWCSGRPVKRQHPKRKHNEKPPPSNGRMFLCNGSDYPRTPCPPLYLRRFLAFMGCGISRVCGDLHTPMGRGGSPCELLQHQAQQELWILSWPAPICAWGILGLGRKVDVGRVGVSFEDRECFNRHSRALGYVIKKGCKTSRGPIRPKKELAKSAREIQAFKPYLLQFAWPKRPLFRRLKRRQLIEECSFLGIGASRQIDNDIEAKLKINA